jgi:RNA polymerase sigma-70 factor (ECF subfamily)
LEEKSAQRALRKKDELALSWFIERYSAYVSAVVHNIIGQMMSESDTEEVVSDVFMTLWANADKVETGKVKAYLGAVARNKAKAKTRELGYNVPLEDDLIVLPDGGLERAAEERELHDALRLAVRSMPPPDREIFLRHYYYYQGVSKISSEMNINPSTVKTHLRRGREKLKEKLIKGGFKSESENLRSDGLVPR